MLEGIRQYWLCVGGANVDVQGVTSARLLPGTSNPGTVHQTAGGVARNVAESLGWLGEEVHLYALVGEDADGEWLRQVTADSGVATHGMMRVPGKSTGRYLAIRDTDGELYTAVSDMAINEAWTDSMVRDVKRRLPGATGLFLDANLPMQVMEALLIEAKREGKKVIVDPVSVKKAKKWRGKLEGVFALVGSIDEMEAISGQSLHSFHDVEKCAQSFVAGGITQVMVICGEAGLCVCNESGLHWLPGPPFPIREKAGDAFAAGVIFAQDKTPLLPEQAAYGIALAELSLQKKGVYDVNELLLRKEFFSSKQVPNAHREAD